MGKVERTIHPACEALPRLPAKAFADLCESIKAIGLQQPILEDENHAIIDGKNRHRACEQVGVAPRYLTVKPEGDLVHFVFSLNKHRLRKSGQLALAAARVATATDGNPKLLPTSANCGGYTREEAARACGVSVAAVDRAKFVLAHGCDELIEYLENGEISLHVAELAAKAPATAQVEACAQDAKAVREMVVRQRENAATETTDMLDSAVSDAREQIEKRFDRELARWPHDKASFVASVVIWLNAHAHETNRRVSIAS